MPCICKYIKFYSHKWKKLKSYCKKNNLYGTIHTKFLTINNIDVQCSIIFTKKKRFDNFNALNCFLFLPAAFPVHWGYFTTWTCYFTLNSMLFGCPISGYSYDPYVFTVLVLIVCFIMEILSKWRHRIGRWQLYSLTV